NLLEDRWPLDKRSIPSYINIGIVLVVTSFFLTEEWAPLGHNVSMFVNYLFVLVMVGLILGALMLMVRYYEPLLRWCLVNKGKFLLIPVFTILLGIVAWLGFDRVFGFIPKAFDAVGTNLRTTSAWSAMIHTFPGMGKEFMPSMDEGTFLLMPTTMPHAGLSESQRIVQQLDVLVSRIPEVELVVGKLGRVESALDPAPVSMFENIINYKPEFILDEKGHPISFRTDDEGKFILASGGSISNEDALVTGMDTGELVADKKGRYFRNWRREIKSTDDIWNEIVKVTALPGVTSAPRLQPIETRLVMLQTGMRAPMGIKVFGRDLETIQAFALRLEDILQQVPSVKAETV